MSWAQNSSVVSPSMGRSVFSKSTASAVDRTAVGSSNMKSIGLVANATPQKNYRYDKNTAQNERPALRIVNTGKCSKRTMTTDPIIGPKSVPGLPITTMSIPKSRAFPPTARLTILINPMVMDRPAPKRKRMHPKEMPSKKLRNRVFKSTDRLSKI